VQTGEQREVAVGADENCAGLDGKSGQICVGDEGVDEGKRLVVRIGGRITRGCVRMRISPMNTVWQIPNASPPA